MLKDSIHSIVNDNWGRIWLGSVLARYSRRSWNRLTVPDCKGVPVFPGFRIFANWMTLDLFMWLMSHPKLSVFSLVILIIAILLYFLTFKYYALWCRLEAHLHKTPVIFTHVETCAYNHFRSPSPFFITNNSRKAAISPWAIKHPVRIRKYNENKNSMFSRSYQLLGLMPSMKETERTHLQAFPLAMCKFQVEF